MSPRPRKAGSLDLPVNLYAKEDKRSGKTYYQYRDPRTGKFHSFGTDKDSAIVDAQALNSEIYKAIRAQRVQITPKDGITVKTFMRRYWAIVEAERKLKENTRRTRSHITGKIVDRLGAIPMCAVDRFACAEFMNAYRDRGKNRMAQAVRSVLVDFFDVAVSEGLRDDNPANATRNPVVVVQRGRLTLEAFKTVLEAAPYPWLRNAMLLGILTGQRREDVVSMRFKDVRDGFLEVRQGKTGACIKISLGLRLEAVGLSVGDVVATCRDNVVSPFLVHHATHAGKAKPGQQVHKDTLSRTFQRAREASGIVFEGKPPTFHEIRSLCGRQYKAEGRDPQALLGHKDSRMTDTYLDGRGQDWVEVK